MAETDAGIEKIITLLQVRDEQFRSAFDRSEQRVKRFEREARRSLQSVDSAVIRSGQTAQSSGAGWQNLGFQVQDFAVQVSSGTSATQALGQQLPQLLSGFGLLGVGLGVAAAAGLPLIRMLMGAGEEAKDAKDAFDTFSTALGDVETYSELAGRSMASLREEFGGYAREVKAQAEEMLRINIASLVSSAADPAGAIGAQFAEVEEAYETYLHRIRGLEAEAATNGGVTPFGSRGLREQAEADLDAAAAAAHTTRAEFLALRGILQSLGTSSTQELGQLRDDMTLVQNLLTNIVNNGGSTPALVTLLRQVTAEVNRLNALTVTTGEELQGAAAAADMLAGVDMSTPVGMAAGEAARLANNLERARDAAQAIETSTNAYQQYQNSRRAGVVAGLGGTGSGTLADRIIGVESGGNPNADNPNSSALGLGQFIESTWLRMFRQHFPDRAEGMTDAAILALRTDAATSRRMVELYIEENAEILRRAGVAVTDANLYLAHFLGPGGAVAVARNPSAPVTETLSAGTIAANQSILGGGRTGLDVINWAQGKVGGDAPLAGAVAAADARTAAETEREATEAAREAERAAEAQADAVDTARDAYANLMGTLDEATARQQAFEEGQKAIADALAAGVITTEQAADATAKLQAALETANVQGALDKILASIGPEQEAAMEAAREAADRLADAAERGAARVADIFSAMADGSMTAKEAIGQLLLEIAKAQMLQGFQGLAGQGGAIGGAFGLLGNLLGGARAMGGPVQAGVPYRVNENTPNSEIFVPSASGAVLTVSQAQAAMRGSAAPSSGGRIAVESRVYVDQSGNWQAEVARISGKVSGVMIDQNNSSLMQAQRRA